MAKIKYSALVSDMRNKLNGSVLSKNRYGAIVRNKTTPVNPQTTYQQNARQSLSNLSSSFRDLGRSAIKGWNSAAKNFPFTDIFGDTHHLSGQALFVKLNANLEKIGQPRSVIPPQPQGFPEIASIAAAFDVDGSEVTSASLTISPATIPAGYALAIYATPGLSQSVSFVKNRFRFLGTGTPVGGSVDILNVYKERFPTLLEGETVHVKVALINTETGQQSIPLMTEAIADQQGG